MSQKQLILGVIGQIHAGKDLLVSGLEDCCKEGKIPTYHIKGSDVVRDFLRPTHGDNPTREQQQNAAAFLVNLNGKDYLLKSCLERARRNVAPLVFLAGIRRAVEVDAFEALCPTGMLVGVIAPEEMRKERFLSLDPVSNSEALWAKAIAHPVEQEVPALLKRCSFSLPNLWDIETFQRDYVRRFFSERLLPRLEAL